MGTLSLLSRPSLRWFSTRPSFPNHDLVQVLTRYKEAEHASTPPNTYKVRAFERAIKVIGDLKEPIHSGSQVRQLSGIGKGVAARIDAFLANIPYETHPASSAARLSTAENKTEGVDDRTRLILASLQTAYGIGKKKAGILYDAGCTSIIELTKPEFFNLLSPSQKVGARFAKHLDQVVPLSQVDAVKEFISQNISTKFNVLLTGDHRRNVSSSHISLIVLHPFEPRMFAPEEPLHRDQKPRPPKSTHFYTMGQLFVNLTQHCEDTSLFADIISPLQSRGLVAATIASGPQRWRGIVRIPQRMGDGSWEDRGERLGQIEENEGLFTMLDIFYVPEQCKGAALIALTGDLAFVTDICGRAHRLGLCLNEYGVWKWLDEGGWEFMHGNSEEEIFREVGMDFIEPERRNFGFLRPKRGRPKKAMVSIAL